MLSFLLYKILTAFIYMKEEYGLKKHTDMIYIYIEREREKYIYILPQVLKFTRPSLRLVVLI